MSNFKWQTPTKRGDFLYGRVVQTPKRAIIGSTKVRKKKKKRNLNNIIIILASVLRVGRDSEKNPVLDDFY